MATIIDALVLELDLDPSKFDEKQKKAVAQYGSTVEQLEEQNRKLKDRNKKVADSFEDVTKKIGAMVAGYVSVGAITSYITQTTQANVVTGQLATTLGIAVDKLSQYKQAARLANISPDAMVGTIQSATNNLNAAAAGQLGGNFWQSYGKLGVQGGLVGPNGQPIGVEEYLRKVQEAVKRQQSTGRYSQGQLTGFLGDLGINQETAYILLSTNNGLDRFLEISKKIGTQTQQQFDDSNKVAGAWNAMATSAAELGRVVLEGLNPALEKMLGWLKAVIDFMKENKTLFMTITGALGGAAAGATVGSIIPGFGTAAGAAAGAIIGGGTGFMGGRGTLGAPGAATAPGIQPPASRMSYTPGAPASGSSAVAPGTSGSLSGDSYLKNQRQSRINEINSDPQLKENVLKMLQLEEGSVSGKTGAMEALLNRSVMTGNTIREELFSGFYGPINRGMLRNALPERARRSSEEAFNNAASGSNIIQGRTDQGMVGDPNANGPGRIRVPGTSGIFNFWKGKRRGQYFSHEDSARFAEETNRNAAGGGNSPWANGAQPLPWLGAPSPGSVLHNQSSTIDQRRSSIDIGSISIQTAAQNASDLATGLEGHMKQRLRTLQATTGLG